MTYLYYRLAWYCSVAWDEVRRMWWVAGDELQRDRRVIGEEFFGLRQKPTEKP